MNQTNLKNFKLPDTPGVYFFLDARQKILYIGKATSLRNRVRSYFPPKDSASAKRLFDSRGPLIVDMVEKARKIEWIATDSVLEALLLEANLIKKHQPVYNSKEKDNKSFNYIVITKEEWPRVLVVRGRNLEKLDSQLNSRSNIQEDSKLDYKIDSTYGPFPQGGILKEALKIVRRIFPFRDTCLPFELSEKVSAKKTQTISAPRPCFNSQIGLCPGVCTGAVTAGEYRATIHQLKLFFEGRKKELIKSITAEMKLMAKNLEFEKASLLKRRLFALAHIQDVALIKNEPFTKDPFSVFRIEAYDIAHLGGRSMVGVMTVVTDGRADKAEYRKFNIRTLAGADDTAALTEVLKRRLGHLEWGKPDLIVTDGGVAQKRAAEAVLDAAELNFKVPVVSVVKNEHHKARAILGFPELSHNKDDQKIDTTNWREEDILLANNEAHRYAIGFHRQKERKGFLGNN